MNLGLWTRLDQSGRIAVLSLVVVGVTLISAQGETVARALVGIFGLLVFVLIALSGRTTALVLVFVWLPLLGFIRRLLIPFAGWAPQDPLLLVSPAAAVILWFTARGRPAPRPSALAGLVGFLALWSAAQIFNPNEGSLIVSVQGWFFFWATPFLWFFVGRTLTEREHDLVLKTVLWMNVVVVGHGLYQTFVDLLPFEYTWLDVSGPGVSIHMAGFRIRPFSTLTSPQEYGFYLSFAIMIIWALMLHRPRGSSPSRQRWLTLFFAVSFVALFYQATRSILLLCLLALAVTFVVHRRSVVAFVGVLVLAVGFVFWSTSTTVPPPSGDARGSEVLAEHQLTGLTNPTGSTAPLHLQLIEEGFRTGIRNPLGIGVSEGTIAAAKVNPADSTSAENDLANTAAALGVLGALALTAIIFAGLTGAVRLQRDRPSWRHLAWVGILVAGLSQWMAGSLYATSTVLFIALGGIAKEMGEKVHGPPPTAVVAEQEPVT